MVGRQKKSDRKMLKAGDLARREDHRVRVSKGGEPEEIGGYHMYAHIFIYSIICLLLTFRSLAAIVSEKSTVLTFSYRKA